jgi:hypothetical protein
MQPMLGAPQNKVDNDYIASDQKLLTFLVEGGECN